LSCSFLQGGRMLHRRRAFGKERKEPGLKNWQQTRYVCAALVYKILAYNA
jgi:hypothetical protein